MNSQTRLRSSPVGRGAPTLRARARSGRWLLLSILLVLALGSAWLAQRLTPAPPPTVDLPREDPDYYLENFTTTTMDEEGRPKRRLSAARLLHFPDTDTNELVAPRLTLFHPQRPPWEIESERGWISATGEVVLLLGRVHVWRDRANGERSIDIRTRDLRILSESDYGETDKSVIIRSQTTETRGVGMRAFLRESRVELLSRVTTRIDRERSTLDRRPAAPTPAND